MGRFICLFWNPDKKTLLLKADIVCCLTALLVLFNWKIYFCNFVEYMDISEVEM